jgi:hypothetical protein
VTDDFRVGDHVSVGPNGKVHWRIEDIIDVGVGDARWMNLKSGMSGFRRTAFPKDLTLVYRPEPPAPAEATLFVKRMLLESPLIREDGPAIILDFGGREHMIELKVFDVTSDRQIP